jgi:predicted transcriptional regulator
MAIETDAAPVDLRIRREQLALTRQELAAVAGCSLSSLAMLETGYRPARSAVRDRVERVLAQLEAEEQAAA